MNLLICKTKKEYDLKPDWVKFHADVITYSLYGKFMVVKNNFSVFLGLYSAEEFEELIGIHS